MLQSTPFVKVCFQARLLGVFQNPQRCVAKHTMVCYKKHTFTENTPKGVLKFGQAKNTPFGGFCNTP